MRVLGIHHGHGAAAALIEDGRVVADVAEERFVRVKHYSGAPYQSIAYCMSLVPQNDIDMVAFSSHRRPKAWALDVLAGAAPEYRPADWQRRLPLYFPSFTLRPDVQAIFVPHHRAHAAAAYYTSGLDPAARTLVVTMDGSGDDDVANAIWRGEGGKLELCYAGGQGTSIGWFYSNVTEALGWQHGEGEGKTMGLAAYGDAEDARGAFDGLHPRFDHGAAVEEHDFGPISCATVSGANHWHLRDSTTIQQLLHKHAREDLAAEAQRVLEHQVMAFVLPWLDKLDTQTLLCSGGVFLNVKLNQRIWSSGRVKDHQIFPNPGDAGLAVGAALDAYHRTQATAEIGALQDVYWGPQYSDDRIEAMLKTRRLRFRRRDDIAADAASALADDKIVAWFQGRMESGPRALGNRSILASAGRAENRDIVNERVKQRETFRPFGPSLLAEHRDEYLLNARNEEFMITSFDINARKREAVPAVTHVDGTVRPQMVRAEVNPLYHRMIQNYGELTGEYLILNTSLNVRGEPIACHPRDALRCFFDSGVDVLCLGSYLLSKEAL